VLPLNAAPEAETEGAEAARDAETPDVPAEADREAVMEDMAEAEAVVEATEAEADEAEAMTACEADEAAIEGAASVELEVELEAPDPVSVSGAALTRAPVPSINILHLLHLSEARWRSRMERGGRLTPLYNVAGVVGLLLRGDRLSASRGNLS
jgi:hypothetical protein